MLSYACLFALNLDNKIKRSPSVAYILTLSALNYIKPPATVLLATSQSLCDFKKLWRPRNKSWTCKILKNAKSINNKKSQLKVSHEKKSQSIKKSRHNYCCCCIENVTFVLLASGGSASSLSPARRALFEYCPLALGILMQFQFI